MTVSTRLKGKGSVLRRSPGVKRLAIVGGLLVLLMTTGVACGESEANPAGEPTALSPGPTSEELRSAKKRAAPAATNTEVADLVRGNSAFAFDLYQNLRDNNGNLFYSPYSISLALAMTYAGARGDTERQMAETLRFLLAQEDLHPAFNALDLELASRGEGAEGQDDDGFRLNVVNAVWGRSGCSYLPDFLEVLGENYGAGVRPLDFLGAPEASRTTINDWVSEQTEERIKDLIPEDAIKPVHGYGADERHLFQRRVATPFRSAGYARWSVPSDRWQHGERADDEADGEV